MRGIVIALAGSFTLLFVALATASTVPVAEPPANPLWRASLFQSKRELRTWILSGYKRLLTRCPDWRNQGPREKKNNLG
jgi:hypothetical protein